MRKLSKRARGARARHARPVGPAGIVLRIFLLLLAVAWSVLFWVAGLFFSRELAGITGPAEVYNLYGFVAISYITSALGILLAWSFLWELFSLWRHRR